VFGALDYGVLAGYFGLCAFVGWWTGRGQKDAAGYFKGGGNMPVWAVCLSILASEMSALTFCSVPGMSYAGNFTYFQFVVGNFFGRLLVAFLFIPAFYTAGITSVYEFLGIRFGPATRGAASILFFVTRILASGIRVTAAAIAVKAATGWPFASCVVGFTALTVLYTVYGGIKSIIWTDVLQFFLFFGGAALALAIILGDIGGQGFRTALSAAPASKLQIVDTTVTFYSPPYTLLTSLVGGVFFTFATHGTDQDLVQRMLTCRGSRQGSRSVVLSGLISLPTVLLFLFIGTCLYAFYSHHPDLRSALPLDKEDGLIRQDWIFPHFIVHQLPAGVRGLVMAAVFAAAMSTTSSAIGALALVAMVDGVRRHANRPADPRRDLALSRIMAAVVSALLIVVAIIFEKVSKSLLNEGLAVMTYAYGALLGVFCLGRLTGRRGSDSWNVVAMLLSVVVVVTVKLTTPVAWPWFTVIGFAMTFGLGALFPTRPRADQTLRVS
jgi:SSS family solute:Na+ symporter